MEAFFVSTLAVPVAEIGDKTQLLAIAAWTVKPDKLDEGKSVKGNYEVFMIRVIAFFVAEIGEKTQIATLWLRNMELLSLCFGYDAGMLVVNTRLSTWPTALHQGFPSNLSVSLPR